MNSLKFTMFFLMICPVAKAQGNLQSEAEKSYEQEMSLEMCGALGRRYDPRLNICTYCAHGLTYSLTTLKCTGIPNVIGKCIGKDHYHAKTQECMYCAKGYKFNEDLKECM